MCQEVLGLASHFPSPPKAEGICKEESSNGGTNLNREDREESKLLEKARLVCKVLRIQEKGIRNEP